MPTLYLITGPCGVGKTTVSEGLANSLEKSVLIEGDAIYNQFVGGRISPWKDGAPLDLFWDNCIYMINNYLNNGYDVVFNYIIKRKELKKILTKFKNCEIKYIVLSANDEDLLERDSKRPLDCQMHERCLILSNEFKDENKDLKYVINSSENTIEEEIKIIIEEERFKCS